MPNVAINLMELSGVTPGTANLKDAVVWFYPYAPYGSPLVTTDKLVVDTVDGVATTFLPQTPSGNGVYVEIRRVRLPENSRKFVVAIPGTDCNLFDLPHLDPTTLDPALPPDPAWLAQLAAEVTARSDGDTVNATNLTNHLNDTVDAHDASAISVVPTGTISSTDVQAAIAELATEKEPTAALDADTAALVASGTLTSPAVAAKIGTVNDATTTKNQRALRRFHVALSTAATTPVDILVGPSDSIGDGFTASSVNKRWISVFRDSLRTVAQPAGVVGGGGYYDLWNQAAFSDYPIVSANSIPNTTYGLGRQSLDFGQFIQTSTITATMTDLDIIYRGNTGPTGVGNGQMLYTIDGDGGHIIETGGKVANGEYVEHVTGLAAGSHTIIIYGNYVGGTQAVLFTVEGVHIYNGDKTKGIRLWEGGQSGYRAADYVTPNTGWASAVKVAQPALVVLPIGSNDYATGRTRAQAKADILAIVGNIRANTTIAPSIALMAYYDRSGSPVTTWADYVSMYNEIAAADPDICVFDLGPLFGPWLGGTDTRGGLTNAIDYTHPTDAGHLRIGKTLARFVAP